MRIAHRYASGREDTVFGVESSVPVYYDLSTSSGKAKLSLSDLPEDTEVLVMLAAITRMMPVA